MRDDYGKLLNRMTLYFLNMEDPMFKLYITLQLEFQ